MSDDLIGYIAERATDLFGGSDGVFSAACFSRAWQMVTGLNSGLDGNAVRAMLHGRKDVVRTGRAHWRMMEGR